MRLRSLAAAALLAAAPAAAQGDSLTIRDFRSEVTVQPDGGLEVTETLRIAFFGPWNGILRDVSLRHNTAQGRREKLRVEFEAPRDAQGRELRHELERPDGWTRRLRVWVPDAHDAERTVVLRYRVRGAIRFFEEGSQTGPLDELYWNVTGNAWTMPIERAEARITLPPGVLPDRSAGYTGPEGSTEREVELTTQGRTVTAVTRRALAPGEGLTVGVGWAPGVIPRPSATRRAAGTILPLWPLLLPLLALYQALRIWRRRGRDPEEREIVVGYEPPAGATPAELGTLVDHKVDMADVTATLVDLAVRGYLRVEEREEKKLLGLLSQTEYFFHLTRPRDAWSDLAEHESRFLSALFTGAPEHGDSAWSMMQAAIAEAQRAKAAGEVVDGPDIARRLQAQGPPLDSVALSSLQNRFYQSLPGIRDAVYEKLMARGYYLSRPDKVTATWVGIGIAVLIVGVGAAAVAAGSAPQWVSAIALGVGLGGSGLIILLFGLAMPARTESGARVREAALGFREFLEKVESDRYRRMITSPEQFERYLPYAMAFGVEERWARAFDGMLQTPPDWYDGYGHGGFRPSVFTSRINTLSSAAGSTMSSSPSSSGSGGGGSSGGGSGGGGGSGF